MENDKIKNQTMSFVRRFKENSGTFKSFEIVFYFVDFLKTEPYLKDFMADVFAYTDEQLKAMEQIMKNDPEQTEKMDNFVFDPLNPVDTSSLPVFKQEQNIFSKAIENKQNLPLISGLSVYLSCLLEIADKFQEIKDCQKTGDNQRVNKLIEIAKEESLSLVSMPVKDGQPLVFTSAQLMAMSMEMVSKYILDHIDSQEFLANDKPKESISFDKIGSILFIHGEKIRIARQKERPIDHYILEAIFAQEDKFVSVDFEDISVNFIKEEYDKEKDWNKFRHACDKLNQKITDNTEQKIVDFIIKSTEKRGWCKINPKYQ